MTELKGSPWSRRCHRAERAAEEPLASPLRQADDADTGKEAMERRATKGR
jgi:hypothetical protein